MNRTRRLLLAGAAASTLLPRAANSSLLHGGSCTPAAPPGIVATLMLTNDGVSTTAAGTPTQSFGWLFKDGDLPSGQAPQFQVGGIPQPFSASVPSIRSYYPSGSLKFCVFALRPTFTLGAGLSQAVSMLSGGTWPTMGVGLAGAARSLTTDVYPQNLIVTMPAAASQLNTSGTGANLTGTWGAWLKNDANLISSGALAPYKDLDGDAGTRWALNVKMAQTQGGAAHGQLIFQFFIWALTDGSGNLGGFRWMGSPRQPFWDINSPSKNWRAFAAPDYVTPDKGPNWAASGVSATPMAWKGADGNPTGALTCTVSGGNLSLSGNNYWLGGSNGNVIPGHFTTNGTLPSPLTTSSVYFVKSFGNGTGPLFTNAGAFVYSGSRANSAYLLRVSGGSGTHKFHPILVLSPFCRLMFADDNARYLFFKGAGSIAAETTLRAQMDKTYWQSTGLIPPWDLTLNPVSITDTPFNNLFHPHGIGSNEQDADGATGVLQNLGIFPNDAVLDFHKRTAKSEKAIRCMGMTWCHVGGDFRASDTGNVVNLGSNTYTGLHAPSTDIDTLQWGQDNAQGFTSPPSYAAGMGLTSLGSTEHQSAYPHWAWLRTGEPQYREFSIEMAVLGILTEAIGDRSTNLPVKGRKGMALSFHNQWRTIAWRTRNLGFAASFCGYDPINPTALGPDGTQTVKMLVDQSDLGYQQVADTQVLGNNYFGSFTSAFINKGRWCPKEDFSSNYLVVSPEWEYAYTIYAACMEAARSGNSSNIVAYITRSAKLWNYYRTAYGSGSDGFYGAFGYYVGWGVETFSNSHIGSLVGYEFITPWNSGGKMSWATTAAAGSGHEFTDGISWSDHYSLHNGDFVVPTSPSPSALAASTVYYVRNYNAGTKKFGLARDKAGTSPVTITDTGSSSSPGGFPSNSTDWVNHTPPFSMGTENLLSMRAAIYWMKAALTRQGVYTGAVQTQVHALITDVENRRTATSGRPYGPLQAIAWTDGRQYTDARYAVAQTFG